MKEKVDNCTCVCCGFSQMTAYYLPMHHLRKSDNRMLFTAVPGQWCQNPNCEKPIKWVTFKEGEGPQEEIAETVPAQEPVEAPILAANWPGVGAPIWKRGGNA